MVLNMYSPHVFNQQADKDLPAKIIWPPGHSPSDNSPVNRILYKGQENNTILCFLLGVKTTLTEFGIFAVKYPDSEEG